MGKIDVKNTMQAHSQAKVDFYKSYLERYMAILCQSKYIKHVRVYDVFCGMGVYDDGGKGSPVVAYDTIKELYTTHKITNNNTKISLIINDISDKRIEKVKEYIDSNKHAYCEVRSYNLEIGQLFGLIIPEINKTTNDTRNLVFIDPYGYKDIRKELLLNLMENGRTEVILFLPISHMQRFTNVALQDDDEKTQYEPLRDFVYSFFSDLNHPIRLGTVGVKDYIRFVADALRFEDKYFATSYYVERDKSNCFALFFMSAHIFGFEKILETKWALDEEHGGGFNLPKKQNLIPEIEEEFADRVKRENASRLKSILDKELNNRPHTNKEIYELVLRKEFLPKHANEVLREMQQNHLLSVIDIANGKNARKNAFYLTYKDYKKDPVVEISIKR